MLTIRITPDEKSILQQAAASTGNSISAFVLNSATAAAKELPKPSKRRHRPLQFRGQPMFVTALFMTAAAGGGHSYEHVGNKIGGAIDSLIPIDATHDEWHAVISTLAAAAESDDKSRMEAWMEAHLPAIWRLVPPRRQDGFLDGMIKGLERRW